MQYKTPIIHGDNQHTPLALGEEELTVESIPVSAAENNIITKNEDGLFAEAPPATKLPCPDIPGGFQPFYQSQYPFGPAPQPGLWGTRFRIPEGAFFSDSNLPNTLMMEFYQGFKAAGTPAEWVVDEDGLELTHPASEDLMDPITEYGVVDRIVVFTSISAALSGVVQVVVGGEFNRLQLPTSQSGVFEESYSLVGICIIRVSTGETLLIPSDGIAVATTDFFLEGEEYCLSGQLGIWQGAG